MDQDDHAPSDEELVVRARAGDADAWRALWSRYEKVLRRQARQRLHGTLRRRLAESDLMQDAWGAVVPRLDDFEDRGPGSFRRWLSTVLAHKGDDAVRRHVLAEKRSARREVSASAVPAADDAATPSQVTVQGEERERLCNAIEGLAGDDRVIICLVHEQGCTFEEAGRVMGRSAEAARKLYGRAVLRLGRRLEPPGA
jgi:RNA polymerase sigma-70 factor (ECF subfamily)